jgi:hypothetical protein
MLGAIAMILLAEIFPSAQRIALIGIINNKQAVPIQPKRRLTFARLSSEFLVLCMTSQFTQFQFLAGRPTMYWALRWSLIERGRLQPVLGGAHDMRVVGTTPKDCKTIVVMTASKTQTITIPNSRPNRTPAKPLPITAPAIAISSVCPTTQPSNKEKLAVEEESNPRLKEPQVRPPNPSPKITPARQPISFNRLISQTRRTANRSNDR